jgi:RpiR family carbohydrate utilization transcriptional regulator
VRESFHGAVMGNVLVKIKSLRGSFPVTQRRLADYVAQYPEEVPFLSVRELGRRATVSVATISRFARSVGYRSYKQFKTELGKDGLAPANGLGGMYRAIGPADSDETVIEKVFHGNVTSLNDTLKILDRRELIRAAELLARSRRMVFFGIGGSGHIGQDAALRFCQLDIQAEAYSDSYQILAQSFRMKPGEVAVGISHSGRSAVTVQSLQIARTNRAATIGIANYLRSPLHEASQVFLCTSFPENQVKVAALTSRIAQTCLIDALYLLVARYRKVSFARTERLNSIVERKLRLPSKS